eukprot:scaffold5_cov331-Pavlova_lutheri.AAC.24
MFGKQSSVDKERISDLHGGRILSQESLGQRTARLQRGVSCGPSLVHTFRELPRVSRIAAPFPFPTHVLECFPYDLRMPPSLEFLCSFIGGVSEPTSYVHGFVVPIEDDDRTSGPIGISLEPFQEVQHGHLFVPTIELISHLYDHRIAADPTISSIRHAGQAHGLSQLFEVTVQVSHGQDASVRRNHASVHPRTRPRLCRARRRGVESTRVRRVHECVHEFAPYPAQGRTGGSFGGSLVLLGPPPVHPSSHAAENAPRSDVSCSDVAAKCVQDDAPKRLPPKLTYKGGVNFGGGELGEGVGFIEEEGRCPPQ